MVTGPDFVVTVRHAESPDLASVRRRMESSPELLKPGPEAVLYAILDQVVDEYSPVIAGVENDIDEIEDQVFAGDQSVSRRIYELFREVIEFQRAAAGSRLPGEGGRPQKVRLRPKCATREPGWVIQGLKEYRRSC